MAIKYGLKLGVEGLSMISYSMKGGSSIGVVSKVHYVMCGGVAEYVESSDACGRWKIIGRGKIIGVLIRGWEGNLMAFGKWRYHWF